MSAPDNTNSTPVIERVRRVGNSFHITYRGGRRLNIAQAVNGPYQSKVSYGSTGGAIDIKPVTQ